MGLEYLGTQGESIHSKNFSTFSGGIFLTFGAVGLLLKMNGNGR